MKRPRHGPGIGWFTEQRLARAGDVVAGQRTHRLPPGRSGQLPAAHKAGCAGVHTVGAQRHWEFPGGEVRVGGRCYPFIAFTAQRWPLMVVV